jgi:hypothetical protein
MQEARQLCILVVDDDKDWRRTIASLLRRHGHLVKCATKDREAGAELETWPFDLVLMNALLRGEIPDDFWRFGMTVLMGEAKEAGSEVIVITSLDKALGKTMISEVATRSKARKVFFKSELERDDLLSEVREISTRYPILPETLLPEGVNCRPSQLAYVLAFHTTRNDLGPIQKALKRRHPQLALHIQATVAHEIGERFQYVQQQLQCFLELLAAMGPDAVCSLCEAVLDVRGQSEDLRENLKRLCDCPREFLGAWTSPEEAKYNLSAIRKLLREAFGPGELRRFCQDRAYLRPVLSDLGEDPGLNSIIDALITYCKHHVLMWQLLTDLEEARTAQFNKHRTSLLGGRTPSGAGP